MVTKLLDLIRGRRRAIDPACGMEVDPRDPPGGSWEYEGVMYHFCSRGCRLSFEEDPAGYLSGDKREGM